MAIGFVEMWRNKLFSAIKTIGTRFIVHMTGFVLLGAATSSIDAHPAAVGITSVLSFSLYIGVICLIPKRVSFTPEWLFPTGTGLASIVVLAIMGLPLWSTVFWGGCITWLMRVLVNKLRMGWEWAVLPWLNMCLIMNLDFLRKQWLASNTLIVVCVALLVGYCAYRVYFFTFRTAIVIKRLAVAQEALAAAVVESKFTPLLEALVEQLNNSVNQFAPLITNVGNFEANLVEKLCVITEGLPKVRQQALSAPPTNKAVTTMMKNIGELGLQLDRYVQENTPKLQPQKMSAEDKKFAEQLALHQTTLENIQRKCKNLPPHIAAQLETLRASATSIIGCMQLDENDRFQGERFLIRYLPAVEHVVDEYLRLTSAKVSDTTIAGVLQHCEELIARLEKAFAEEHIALLQNDTVTLSAELKALDTLLTMQGR